MVSSNQQAFLSCRLKKLAKDKSNFQFHYHFPFKVLTQDGLATLMNGMITQQSPLSQPLLVPLNMGGSVGGQNGLALLTLPTTTLATLPGFGGGSAGGLIKLPFAGLQGKVLLRTGIN